MKYRPYWLTILLTDGTEPEGVERHPIKALITFRDNKVLLEYKEERTVEWTNETKKNWYGASISVIDEDGAFVMGDFVGPVHPGDSISFNMTMSKEALRERVAELELLIGEYADMVGTSCGVYHCEGSDMELMIRSFVNKYRQEQGQ